MKGKFSKIKGTAVYVLSLINRSLISEHSSSVPKIKGSITYVLRDAKTGEIKHQDVSHNLVTTVGRQQMGEKTHGVSAPAVWDYVALGNGTTASESDTTLSGSELGRKQGTAARTGTTIRITVSYTTSEGNGTIREAGIFNAAVAGTMLTHDLRATPLVKTSSDTLDLYYEVTY